MSEIKQFVCPNCGANITNTHNCEYCGSLLVRLLDNGIDAKTYLSEHGILPGLTKALEENIRLQKENNGSMVATDIYGEYFATENYCFANVVSSNQLKFRSGKKAFPYSKEGIGVIFCFEVASYKMLDKNDIDVIESKRIQSTHEKFKKLEIFNLFTSHTTSENFVGDKYKYYEYAIDFGEDAEGAARLLSNVLNQIYDIPNEAHLDYTTNIGEDNIESSRLDNDEDSVAFVNAIKRSFIICPFVLLALYVIAPLIGRQFNWSLMSIVVVYIISVVIAFILGINQQAEDKKKRINKNNHD